MVLYPNVVNVLTAEFLIMVGFEILQLKNVFLIVTLKFIFRPILKNDLFFFWNDLTIFSLKSGMI